MIKPLEKNLKEDVQSLQPLCRAVYRRTGLDLHPYKEKFLRRRVAVRLRATGLKDLEEYVGYLRRQEEEIERFLLSFTIHVSTFFRNPSTYEAIGREVLPRLFPSGTAEGVRVWSVGCARGEEPYSLAILISEHLGRIPSPGEVRIEASDVDEKVLVEAKRGEFSQSQLRDLDPLLVQKYFRRDGAYRLVPEIRKLVKFHRSDVFMDPLQGEYDFILCRNLLIYIERQPQEEVLERFHRSLHGGGYLVLGRTEAVVGGLRKSFEAVDHRERIYRKIS